MKKITAYQSLDGQIFQDELIAVKRDFQIEMRGLVQSFVDTRNVAGDMVRITALHEEVFAKHSAELINTIHKYQRRIRGIESRQGQ